MYRRLLLLAVSALVLAAAVAQSPNRAAQPYELSRRINSGSGLSNDFVLSLALDGQGYVWVATEAGLNRIAGNVCQPFPAIEQLAGRRVTALYWHEPTRQMLIGTESGLAVYRTDDGSTQWLTHTDGLISSSINGIAQSAAGVWLVYGNGQVQQLDCRQLKPTTLEQPQVYASRCALDDGHGHLYIGHSQHGLTVVDLNSGRATNYQEQRNTPGSLPGNNVRCICQDRQQRIWVGTGAGLALFHPASGTFRKVVQVPDRYDDNVYDVRQMNDGTLWVATDIGGVRIVNPDAEPLCYTDQRLKLSSLNTRSILQDDYGNVWVGNHSTGVDFISARQSDFSLLDYQHSAYAIARNADGSRLWMVDETGLSCWQAGRLTGRWTAQGLIRREYAQPRCVMADRTGRVWVGVDDQGVYRFDERTARFDHIALTPEGSDIHSFFEDDKGRVWIGGEFGVYVCQNGQVQRHEALSQTVKAPVTCFLEPSPNQLFVATLGDGIYSYNLQTKTSRHLSENEGLPSSKVNQVVPSSRGGLWMATDGGLVYLADPVGLKGLRVYGHEQGLADAHVLALQQDADDRIWLSTYAGISCFFESTDRFYNYSHLDTPQLGGFAFGAASTDAEGTIFFGSASGVCYIRPDQHDAQDQVSDVQIVTFEAYNPVGPNTEWLQLVPDGRQRVQTTYRQNTLRLAFTVRNYAQTDRVEYSYMMKGMDSKWYEIGNDHDVVFRGLRPGRYTFILRAKLRNQDWSHAAQTQIDISIAPPFWRTWWAWLVYALLLVAAGWQLARLYKRRLTQRNALELERREHLQKQELNEERLRFFTNITHELRTPLTLILGPLDDLMDDPQLPQSYKRRVATIQKSAERLRSLISDILEFRKTETQNRRLTVARGDIGQFVREICLNYQELFQRNGSGQASQVQFVVDVASGLPPVYFDSEVITTIMNNLLSNAIKYTEQGSITTTVRAVDGDQISIVVADTGHGIAADALPHVFERYYQAKGSHQASGTGIGLALAKSLADLHEAQLSVESSDRPADHGSRFTLLLSTVNTYPAALHKEDSPQHPLPATDAPMSTAGDAAPATLLVVEDNADIRQYIADTFSADFHILSAQNGAEGIEMARQAMPDIIVSDIMMPRLDGIQMTRQLKNDVLTSHIPIILLTAKTTDDDREEGYDSGADSYLTKPFTAKLLASRIQNLLAARRRLADRLFQTGQPKAEPDSGPVPPQSQQLELSRLDREFLDKLNAIISDNIMQQDIDLPFVTERMYMSHSTFYRKIKALTGLTAKEYIRKFRLQHCYKLLESGDYNVTEAAMMTGFNQMAHFREVFKKEFGMLPSDLVKSSSKR